MAFNQNPENNNNNNSDNNPNPTHRLYNPYADLQIPAHKLYQYQLPSEPEFLFHEESIHQRRSWGENLTYYTGCGYLAGASSGASIGFYQGVRAIESSDTLKLRLNRVLNSTGSTGRQWGNRVGVVGLMYAGLESGLVYLRDTDDVLNSVAAGLATGALYKAASGPKAAAIAGAAGGIMVGIMVGAKQAIKRYIPL